MRQRGVPHRVPLGHNAAKQPREIAMPLDPQCEAVLAAAASVGSPLDQTDPCVMRAAYRGTTASYWHPTAELAAVVDRRCPGRFCEIPVRIYRPRSGGDGALPALVFYHGGGWVLGDLDTHDHLCRHLAHAAGACVVAVDYRLAPEHKYPAALEDAVAAARWIAANGHELGIDGTRLALGGDSAGGNLAAAAALVLRDEGGPAIRLQLLFYPALDFTADNTSLAEFASGYLLTRAAIEKFADWYLPDRATRAEPLASPQRAAHHRELPAAFIMTAEFDPLRDEGAAYAETLRRAGVPVDYRCYPGMLHGFARMGGRIDLALNALDDAAAALRKAFAG